jgi:hypothetical protein
MPAKNPRLTITLEPSTAAQLRRISELTGNSQSALIADLLSGTGTTFDRLITVLETAQNAKAAIKGKLAGELEQAQHHIESQLGLRMEDSFFRESRSLLDEFERINRRARKASPASAGVAPARGSTPMSNRGVRSTTKTGKSPNEKQGVKRGSI